MKFHTCLEWTVSFGVLSGYADNAGSGDTRQRQSLEGRVDRVAMEWQLAMESELVKSGTSVSGLVVPGAAVYARENRCPVNGEAVAVVTGCSSPDHDGDLLKYRDALVRVVDDVRHRMRQVTVRLVIHEAQAARLVMGNTVTLT